jgi:hypothetical protein
MNPGLRIQGLCRATEKIDERKGAACASGGFAGSTPQTLTAQGQVTE